ncbi:MAG TPA: AarF/UbiB family protein [Candidatus Didemnitutus sp.]|jgi:predicted unusual protein kinase regulating ubiquinone biosynthesis (AarF/ABC1/UbiB family)
MKLSASHLTRYRQIAALLWKYGRTDLVQQLNSQEGFGTDVDTGALPSSSKSGAAAVTPENLADDLEELGPTYVKLGQVLAGRPDLLPPPYLKGLARLQDHVRPFSYAEVEQTVLDELGVRISKAFSRFDPEPVAAASLGQVHRAALRDGRPVVVKVQRPHIRRQIAEDFEVLEEIAGFLDRHTTAGQRRRFLVILEEFRLAIQQELNYEREAHNLVALGRNLAAFKSIQVPQPIPDYYSKSVLTMEEVDGQKISSLGPIARLELKGAPLAEDIFRAYLQQVLLDGLFHADPHPGNVFITNDGRIALIDLGMVGHVGPGMQENLLKILLAIGEGNGDAAAEVAIQVSEKLEDFSAPDFRRRITHLVALRRDQGLEQMNVGGSLLEVSGIAQESGLIVPSDLVLIGKTMLQLDEIGRFLDPTFDANASIRRNVTELMATRLRRSISKGSMYTTMLESKELVAGLPSRLNRVMDLVSNSDLEIRVRATDAKTMLDGMQKIANRITTGVVLAGLLIGASLLMRVPTGFHLFGFPGLAILCFVAAATGGFWLVISIFVTDYRGRKK